MCAQQATAQTYGPQANKSVQSPPTHALNDTHEHAPYTLHNGSLFPIRRLHVRAHSQTACRVPWPSSRLRGTAARVAFEIHPGHAHPDLHTHTSPANPFGHRHSCHVIFHHPAICHFLLACIPCCALYLPALVAVGKARRQNLKRGAAKEKVEECQRPGGAPSHCMALCVKDPATLSAAAQLFISG